MWFRTRFRTWMQCSERKYLSPKSGRKKDKDKSILGCPLLFSVVEGFVNVASLVTSSVQKKI